MDVLIPRIIDTLVSYGLQGDVLSTYNQSQNEWEKFHDCLLRSISLAVSKERAIPLDCWTAMCYEISRITDESVQRITLTDVVHLMPYFQPTEKSICQLFDWLRASCRSWGRDRAAAVLPPELHVLVLEQLGQCLQGDNPSHILFPGEKDSFLEVSSIPWSFRGGFTLAIWIKVPTCIPNKGFELFRCKSPLLSIEATLLANSEDGVYSVRIVSSSEKRGRDEIRGKVVIPVGGWHLLTVKYLGGNSLTANTIGISIDGSVEMEGKFMYPVVSQSLETLWTFGISFAGQMSSITLYDGEVNPSFLHFLHGLGPYLTDIGKGVYYPQSTHDTGHSPLGTLFTKGPWAKLHRLPRVFCITALATKSNFTMPLHKAGRQFSDFIAMTPLKTDGDLPLIVSLHGKCKSILSKSWVDQLVCTGGILLPLYLFWSYSIKIGKADFGAHTSEYNQQMKVCMLKSLRVVQYLLQVSIDAKEQLLQTHGFHVLAHCIYSALVENAEYFTTDALVIEAILSIVAELRYDASKGDGIAAALQGILFDFRIWSQCSLPNLKLLLEGTATFSLKAGDQLFNAIGIQRLLDLVRVHLLKPLTIRNDQEEQKEVAIDCADEIFRMLIIMKDAAVAHAAKQKTNIATEVECLLCCLEETNNNLLSERILRLLSNIRHTSPSSLKRAVIHFRFHDTTILSLWMRRNLSMEVRSQAFIVLLWMLSLEVHMMPAKLHEIRKNLKFVNSVQLASNNRRIKPSQNDAVRYRLGLQQLKEEARGLSKIWRNQWMLAETLDRALRDEIWGYLPSLLPESNANDTVNNKNKVAMSGELQILILLVSNEFQRTSWLLLPFLPQILSRCDLDSAVKVLMLINLEFKTNECIAETLIATEMEMWVTVFVKLALLGIRTFVNSAGDTCVQLETFSDISIDTFAIVVDYLLRFQADEDSALWQVLVDVIRSTSQVTFGSDITAAKSFEAVFLRRATSLVLQRVVKTNEDGWNILFLRSIDMVLDVVSKNHLHKPPPTNHQASLLELSETESLELAYQAWITKEGEQLLYFVLDMMNSVQRACKRHSFQGTEWMTFMRAYGILLESIGEVSDLICERLVLEIRTFIAKASEVGAPFTDVEFLSMINKTFAVLKENILKSDYANPKRMKLEGCVFAIIGHFTDLRIKMQTGFDVSPHVVNTIKALRVTESIGDIKVIFDILDVLFKDSQPNIISFDEAGDDNLDAAASVLTTGEGDVVDLLGLTEDSTPSAPNAPDSTDTAATIGSPAGLQGASPVVPDASNRVVSMYLAAYNNWLLIRQGITAERVDSERARLSRAMNLQDIATEATKKFWRRCRRKIESEAFNEAHFCQWKLGVAHEGPFFGRKRLVLRPRYENFYSMVQSPMLDQLNSSNMDLDMSSDELTEALQKQYTGYIKDVTRSDTVETTGSAAASNESADATDGVSTATGAKKAEESLLDLPGNGWGVVGADDSEEGYGVVGVANDASPSIVATSEAYATLDEDITSKASEGAKKTSANQSQQPSSSEETAATAAPAHLEKTKLHEVSEADELYRCGRASIETGPSQAPVFKLEHARKLEAKVVMITASGTCWGVLAFNGEDIYFRSSQEQSEARKQDNASVNAAKETKLRRRRWKVENVSYIYLRRYRLRDSALEIFFRQGKHRSVFVDFGHTREDAKIRSDFSKAIAQAAPPSAFKQTPTMSAFRMVYEHDNIQEKWLQGKLSNFDYLMALNTIAGRSFNDLCQYPVMPWVISDYTSTTLNLQDPASFRDLSKPMGALNPTRLKEFLDRFNSFEDNVSSGIPAFMYGSHYSTMVGVVLHFLVRLQPFAALHQEMQNGHFDVPDRLFSSIPRSYAHNTNQLSEVKELIPEFFTTPDIFRNINNFDFGETQDGENIDNVELPPWAKTPEDFVRINREALESDYVSEHLHEWIDLIFGYKQRGPDAVEACNVFYYLTYYGSVDHYLIKDEAIRKATELQIAHFGQIPMQLFKTPHPARRMHKIRALPTYVRPLRDCFAVGNSMKLVDPKSDEESIVTEGPATLVMRNANNIAVACTIYLDRVLIVLDNGVMEVLKYGASDEVKATLQAAREAAKDEAQQVARANRRGSNLNNGSASTSIMAADISAGGSFPEDFLFPSDPPSSQVSSKGRRTGSITDEHDALASMDSSTSSVASSSLSNNSNSGLTSLSSTATCTLKEGESIFTIEKELTHFEVVPRLPISKKLVQLKQQLRTQQLQQHASLLSDPVDQYLRAGVANSSGGSGKLPFSPAIPSTSESIAEATASLVVFSRNNQLALCIGSIDGTISVRDIDSRTGTIRSAGDFCAHKCRVVSAAIDSHARDGQQVVASLDESGIVLVWMIHPPHHKGEHDSTTSGQSSGSGGGSSTSHTTAAGGSAAAGANSTGNSGDSNKSSASSGGTAAGNAQPINEQETLAKRNCHTINRRPHRLFRIDSGVASVGASGDMRVDISWSMGVVTAVSGSRVHLLSIERNELLRVFDLQYLSAGFDDLVSSLAATAPAAVNVTPSAPLVGAEEGDTVSASNRECSCNGPRDHLFSCDRFFATVAPATTASTGARHVVRRLTLSDDGILLLHVESFIPAVDNLLEYEDDFAKGTHGTVGSSGGSFQSQHCLVAHRINGQLLAVAPALSPITCLTCPDRGDVVLCGHRDGSLVVYRAQNLAVLYRLQPDHHCVPVSLLSPLAGVAGAVSGVITKDPSHVAMRNQAYGHGHSSSSKSSSVGLSGKNLHDHHSGRGQPSPVLDSSAIIAIAVGPVKSAPALLCITTEAGNLHFKALPDFVRWERNRNPTVLQIASEQLQAVKGSILQAQNWGAETAGVIAQNALAEFKKIRSSSLVKNVFGFFGGADDSKSGDAKSNNNANNNSKKK